MTDKKDSQKATKKKQRLTVKLVKDLIVKKSGNVSAVARETGWSRGRVRDFIESHKSLQDTLQEARETMDDAVQTQFYAACLNPQLPGHVTAMIFYLKTRCGWVEKQSVDMAITDKQVHVYIPSNERGDEEQE